MTEQKVVVVTGGSTGIGLEIAVAFAAAGYITYATTRDKKRQTELVQAVSKHGPAASSNLKVIELEVTSDSSVQSAFHTIYTESKKIDILINNAALAYRGPLESWTPTDVQKQFDINVTGVVRCIQQVLPSMRANKHGTIINISSLLGMYAPGINSLYSASKFALEAITQGLYQEVKPWGIKVIIVQPGLTKSAFGENAKWGGRKIEGEPYEDQVKKMSETREQRLKGPKSGVSEPEEVAVVVLRAAREEEPQFRYQIGEGGEQFAASLLVTPKQFHSFTHK